MVLPFDVGRWIRIQPAFDVRSIVCHSHIRISHAHVRFGSFNVWRNVSTFDHCAEHRSFVRRLNEAVFDMDTLDLPVFPLTGEQTDQLKLLETSLSSDQALWLSGYFAALSASARVRTEPTPTSLVADTAGLGEQSRRLTVLYGSETGNSGTLARKLGESAIVGGLGARVVDMAQYKVSQIKEEQDVLIIISTHGEGDPPQPAADFFDFVEGRKAPRLPQLRFAVLALGDSTYEHFCEAGKRLDRRVEELGATRLQPRIDCDVDYEDESGRWVQTVLTQLRTQASTLGSLIRTQSRAGSVALPAQGEPTAVIDKNHPTLATVIDNLVLTGRGSSKETRHVEVSLGESRLGYRPGDSLGFVPQNDPVTIEAILETLAVPADTPVSLKKGEVPLERALRSELEVNVATPRFLKHWAELSGASALERLTNSAPSEERAAFLATHHIIDIIRRFPVSGIRPQQFVTGLRPLQPRLYSIASSNAVFPDEAHLTVATVRYSLHGESRLGVASGQLATRSPPDVRIPVYVQSNPLFRLPEDDRPVIMIGAGTGVAPYRAFLQEREARGSGGKTWLIFGERNFRSDFLYQREWQTFLSNGILTRMNVAFSRDGAQKVYVQHRMMEHARDLYAWLEEGGNVYVCGDAAHFARDVHLALVSIVEREREISPESADEYVRELQRERRYQRDVY